MFRKANKLERLRKEIVRSFKGKKAPEVSMLPEEQMLVSKNMLPNPAAELGGKSETFVPGIEGYEIYVAYRIRSDYVAMATTAQRALGPTVEPTPWKMGCKTLLVDRESLKKDWQILNHEGKVVSISVDCGSEKMTDEVNLILSKVATVLLGEPLKGE